MLNYYYNYSTAFALNSLGTHLLTLNQMLFKFDSLPIPLLLNVAGEKLVTITPLTQKS